MQNERSTQKPKSFAWPVIAGHAITVAKSSPGDGHNGYATVSPFGLIRTRGSGLSPYRAGFQMQKLATRFCRVGGMLSAVNCNGDTLNFRMLPLLRHIHDVTSFPIFISLRSHRLHEGSKTWLCTQALVIKRKR